MTYLLLGANLGDRVPTLRRAVDLIAERVGVVAQQSGLYETAPWGVTDQPNYLNQVLAVETNLTPEAVLAQTQAIEQELTIPHPYLHQRRFTLVPLAEIGPNFVHPILGKTTIELLSETDDIEPVNPFMPVS